MKDIKLNEALRLLDICPMPMLLTGEDNKIRGCNTAFTALTGVFNRALTPDDVQHELIAPLLKEGTTINWVSPEGIESWLSVEKMTVTDGSIVARFYLDVSEKQRLKKERDAIATKLSEESLKDERLTSLLSRHGILVSLGPLVARSRRYNSPLSIITMSIDSAQKNDALLHKLSILLKDQTRWADLVGCNDQGDFILILQEATRDSALQLVEKLAAKLETVNTDPSSPAIASYGIAQCDKNDNAASLLERAESALVEAHSSESRTSIAM